MTRVKQELSWISEEARKCFYCVDAPCVKECPASIDIPQFIRNLKFGNINKAKSIIKEANCLGGTCGYLCPSENLCESKCVRAKSGQSVQIRELQRYVCDNGKYIEPEVSEFNGKRVAVVGSGPSGISCAYELSLSGCKVDIFEKADTAGGTVRHEIPSFRIPESCINRDYKELSNLNISYKYGINVTSDMIRDKLCKEYDAVFLSIGLTVERDTHIDFKPSRRIFYASDFLKSAKEGNLKLEGTVLVFGGGDTAMDAARYALKIGASASEVVYRRSRNEMPAGEEQIIAGIKDGIGFMYLTSCLSIEEDKKLTIELVKNELTSVEGSDKKTFKAIEGSNFTLEADYAVFAFGKKADAAFLAEDNSKIFIGGDFKNGGATIVEGVKEGKEAAAKILEYLK